MKKLLLSALLFLMAFTIVQDVWAQPATYNVPFSIGRNNCGSGSLDSVYFFNYSNSTLTNNTSPKGCKPLLLPKPFSIFAASVSFNPRDANMYYIWTDYAPAVPRSYIWRWNPTTCPTAGPGLNTINQFDFDIGGITFDPDGFAWQLEFSAAPPYKAYLRQLDFVAGTINGADTLDLLPGAGGIGDTLYNVGSGDITMTPSGQMYFVFDNKLYTPDYGSWNNPTHHIKATYIDTVRKPAGASSLVGLAFADGDLIASYSPGCLYKKIDPITGDTSAINYTYGAGLGVRSTDMSQINSGLGVAKSLFSITPTGTPNQYDVVYDVYVRNYGNVPITNVQVTDNLGSINGASNVSNVTTSFSSNPAGFTRNTLYNGTTNLNLLNAGQTLNNYPSANNNFTIRISCRLSNIQNGIVYNNSAIGTANGFNSTALRDSSTNGGNPDLNQNDRPDDLGEGQPTPFLITITPTTPACSVLEQTLYSQNFGTGTGLQSTLPAVPSASTTFTGTTTAPLPIRRFATSNNASLGDPANWISLTDHTGGVNGRMMLLNADAPANIIYRDTLPVACSGQQYSLSFWAAFIGNSTYQSTCDAFGGFVYPKILIRIRDLSTGLAITQYTTGDVIPTTWQQLGIKWVMPAGFTNVIFELINAGAGGCGNDFAIDDIVFGICDPLPRITTSGMMGCIGGSSTFNSNLTDATVIPGAKDYQWQRATVITGPYTNIAGATSATFIINPVLAADTGVFYRLIVAAQGNIGVTGCQYLSDTLKLTGKIPSVAAASATRNKNNICSGISVNLGVTGGTLGTNATWRWFTGSCGSTLAGTGSTLTVTPSVTTTYYVMAQGDCNTTTCQAITVTVICNIDKDRDGIPDYVESYMGAALTDLDGDGISNAFDLDYAGYIDINNDHINDNFQADGDSDNDGIANNLDATFPGRIDSNSDGVDDRFDMDRDGIINMLDLDSDNDGVPDVVEAAGVDADGDAKIDNYTDTDNDGLSQNVDVNNTGARISGIGLGVVDYDNDTYSNTLDRDSDNDGVPDVIEVTGPDTNNDGIIDGFVDANLDGIADNRLTVNALLKTGTDITSDGRADSYPNKNFDSDKMPNVYDVDSDMDGIIDVIEAGFADTDYNGFIDGAIGTDGWNAAVNALATLTLTNTDTRGNPNYIDIDADDDGIPDNVEGQTTASYLLPVYLDNDNDGLDNSYDNIVGFGGRGVFLSDKDIDGIPDYRDLDTDADGQPDIKEGNDFNLNGTSTDDNTTLTLLDTDGDGLDNRFDSLNSVTNIKGTSYRMGNGGTLTGDAAPGSRTVVQKTLAVATDRDWRYVGYVLNVQLVNFRGNAQNNLATLDWGIITPFTIDRFEIERSTDNVNFEKISTLTDNVNLNVLEHFAVNDDISLVKSEYIYYKLKVIAVNGQVKYSNVVVIRKSVEVVPVVVFPNPASEKFTVQFTADKEGEATLRMFDKIGREVLTKKHNARKGLNEVVITNLTQFPMGVYSLHFVQSGGSATIKVIIQHKK
ncbi:MAG: T9SS type A sorting domain-containing protein [Ferruginibacter sp.]